MISSGCHYLSLVVVSHLFPVFWGIFSDFYSSSFKIIVIFPILFPGVLPEKFKDALSKVKVDRAEMYAGFVLPVHMLFPEAFQDLDDHLDEFGMLDDLDEFGNLEEESEESDDGGEEEEESEEEGEEESDPDYEGEDEEGEEKSFFLNIFPILLNIFPRFF